MRTTRDLIFPWKARALAFFLPGLLAATFMAAVKGMRVPRYLVKMQTGLFMQHACHRVRQKGEVMTT